MSTRRSAALDVRNSIEAKTGLNGSDVEMRDGSDAEGEEEEDDDEGNTDAEEPQGMMGLIQNIATWLCKIEEDGELLAAGFQRVPNKRVLPDYYDVITVPVAFSTIRGKLLRKTYANFSEFVRDVAQICHNAQVYNRPSAPIFGAAQQLRQIFKERLQKLVEKGQITAQEAELPDLGEIPETEDSPPPASDDEGEEDDEDDEDEDEDDEDDSDEEGGRRRGGRRGRRGIRGRGGDDDRDDDTNKKRGRPPSVLTPMEARIHNLLRGLRKPKDDDGALLILPFERLPDKTTLPDYYTMITNPIALDQIKRKAKRKKYTSVDHAMQDVELMFENAKHYNEDQSPVYTAAVELQKAARGLADQEKAKPDDDFRDEDGKLPLSEIQHNGQSWRVGDWVHIRNPNDLAKPIVAQIYRTWQDRAGQKWINSCWYYRPEQTVHRFEKHFYPHEVVKTGQYRDHQIEEVLDHCFVMFVTRFPKGRPRGFPPDKDVYVCESRYNEEKFRFNKIKTWASCVPDEVREKDYEMDLFDVPRKMRKVPSPIKHLLQKEAKETDGLPKPTWGSTNAPPIVGAVHRRPREANESPPPEPSPPPTAIPPVSQLPDNMRRQSTVGAPQPFSGDMSRRTSSPFAGPPAARSPGQYNNHMTPHFQPVTPGPAHHGASPQIHHPQLPMQPLQYQPQQAQFRVHPQHYGQSPMPVHQPVHHPVAQGYNRSPGPQHTRPQMPGHPTGQNMYNPPRPPEVYTLQDSVNVNLPESVRNSFQHDSSGRVIFYTTPPMNRPTQGLAPESASLGHSVKYLARREEWLAERERKRKERDEAKTPDSTKRAAVELETAKGEAEMVMKQAIDAVDGWFRHFDKDTEAWKDRVGLSGWHPTKGAAA